MEAIDLFEHSDLLPKEVDSLLLRMGESLENGDKPLSDWLEELQELGFTFDYYVSDFTPFALCSLKLFKTIKKLHEWGRLQTPKDESDDSSPEYKTFVNVLHGYYTFKNGEVHQITLNELLGK